MSLLRTIRQSSSLYPITQLYLFAVAVIVALVQGWVNLTSAVVILGLAAVLAILVAAWAELRQIHEMIDGQRTELVGRIDLLSSMLDHHGVPLPPEPGKVHEARVEKGGS